VILRAMMTPLILNVFYFSPLQCCCVGNESAIQCLQVILMGKPLWRMSSALDSLYT